MISEVFIDSSCPDHLPMLFFATSSIDRQRRMHSLVCTDTSGFESLGAHLFILVGNKVDAEGKLVDTGALATEVKDTDLWVRYTTVEPGLGVRLAVGLLVSCSCLFGDNIGVDVLLAVAVTPCWTSGHCCGIAVMV